jgi:hypothetical protein
MLNKIHNKYTDILGNILHMSSFVSECSLGYGMLLINQVKFRVFTIAFVFIYWCFSHWSPVNCCGIGGYLYESN